MLIFLPAKMPNKNTPNGFYMFMIEEQRKVQAQTKRMPSMHEMPAMCQGAWRSLSAAQKAHYDNLAKQEKARQRGGSDKDKYRKDNQRQIIAFRVNPAEVKEKRKKHESQLMTKSWKGHDILDFVFYVIDFEVMYDERAEDHHLPMEVGMVAFTLRDGLLKHWHTFIDPGDAPQGNRHLALKHSENTHKIPLNFSQADSDFKAIWAKIHNFVEDGDSDDIPPLYCLSDYTEIVESCLDFLHVMSGSSEPNRLQKIYCMDTLIASLIMESGKTDRKPSESQINDNLKQNIWDYNSSIRCSYHEETDCSYCSLSKVRRYCYTLFDRLSGTLDFSLTTSHQPEEPLQQFTVLPPETFGRSFGRGNRRRDNFGPPAGFSGREERGESPPPFRPHESRQPPQSPTPMGRQPPRAWAPPVGRFEIHLDDDDDNDEEDDDVNQPRDLKSTADQYQLKELRKPKTPSMLQAGGNMHVLANLGRGAGIRGRGQAAPGMVPPPGFGVRPMMQAPGPGAFSHSHAPPPSGVWANQGRGRGRGRGLPPQI